MSLGKAEAYIDEHHKALELLRNEDKNDGAILSILGKSYFCTGRFEQSYETYNKLYYDKNVDTYMLCGKTPEEFDPFGKVVFNILNNLGAKSMMDTLPKYMDYEYKQSVENSNGSYEESIEGMVLLKRAIDVSGDLDRRSFDMWRMELDRMRTSKDVKLIAKSYFLEGEIWLSSEHYENAFKYYIDAAKSEVSKALYYGFAGNMLFVVAHRETGETKELILSPLVSASILTYRAIDLDYNNARWHFNEGLILLKLGFWYVKNGQADMSFIKSAKYEFTIAKQVLRPDQLNLKSDIEQQLQWINDTYFN